MLAWPFRWVLVVQSFVWFKGRVGMEKYRVQYIKHSILFPVSTLTIYCTFTRIHDFSYLKCVRAQVEPLYNGHHWGH